MAAMFRKLFQGLGRDRAATPTPSPVQPKPTSGAERGASAHVVSAPIAIPIYPPTDGGVPVCTPEQVVQSQAQMHQRMRLATGMPEDRFEQFFGAPIRALAANILLLPASATGTHCGAGGLFRLAMETAFYAYQTSEATIFAARAGVERRRELEPRWRYATWLAGLCAELHRAATLMLVTSPKGERWPVYQEALANWLSKQGTERYFVKWSEAHDTLSGSASVALAQRIIPPEALAYLHEGGNELIPTMFAAMTFSGNEARLHPMERILRDVQRRVQEKDAAIRPQSYGKLTVGTHFEPHLLDAMRSLISRGRWQLNGKKTRLWMGDEGLFLIWPGALRDILEEMDAKGVSGIPREHQTIADILINANVCMRSSIDNPYWSIYPPGPNVREMSALRFATPMILLDVLGDDLPSAGVLTSPPEAGDAADAATPSTAAARDKVEAGSGTVRMKVDADGVLTPDPEAGSEPCADQSVVEQSGPPTGTPEPAKPSRSAAPPAPPPASRAPGDEAVDAALPGHLGQRMSPLVRSAIEALVTDIRQGSVERATCGKVKDGYALSIDLIKAYGVDVGTITAALKEGGWLITKAESPDRKIYEVQIDGALRRAVLIDAAIAIELGLSR